MDAGLDAGEAAMNALVFLCPGTGREIDTGMDVKIDFGRLANVQPITVRLLCPHCHKAHVWKIADGWIREPRAADRYGEWRRL